MIQISSNFGAEITFKDNYFEIHGTENEVRSAVAFLMDQDILKVSLTFASVDLVLATHAGGASLIGLPTRDTLPD
jgi:hypothetical protein